MDIDPARGRIAFADPAGITRPRDAIEIPVRLIVDYSHNRLFAIPVVSAIEAPLDKDRIGIMLVARGSTFVVGFVAPGSPAAAAGFR